MFSQKFLSSYNFDLIYYHYDRIFGIDEIRRDKRLIWIYNALILGFYLAFSAWIFRPIATLSQKESGDYVCPEFFRNCYQYFFLEANPHGYSYNLLFALMGGLLVLLVVWGYQGKWRRAHALMSILFFIKLFFGVILNGEVSMAFEIFHMLPCFVFLFSRKKLGSLKLTLIVLYFFSGIVKIHEAWIAGTYFSTLKLGLPFIPRSIIPVVTNIGILLELIGSWFLLSQKRLLKDIIFWSLIVFHIYSSLFIGFRFPLHSLPFLIILFGGPIYQARTISLVSILSLMVFSLFNLIPFLIPGDHKITYEGMSLAVNMFDSNRQAFSRVIFFHSDGKQQEDFNTITANSFERIVPYKLWYRIKTKCEREHLNRAKWILDISNNGNAYRRVIDTENACVLDYKSLQHNEWINLNGPVVGYPGYDSYFPLGNIQNSPKPEIFLTPQIQIDSITAFLKRKIKMMIWIYSFMAFFTPFLISIPSIRRKWCLQL